MTTTRFPTTRWTMIQRAELGQQAFEELLRRYWSPVLAYFRRKGHQQADAEDLTQGFLADVAIQRDLFGRADRSRGRFRSYLRASLENYRVDQIRKSSARPMTFLPADPAAVARVQPSESDTPSQAFDRQWISATLTEALRRIEEACNGGGLSQHWLVFEQRVLGPLRSNGEPTPTKELLKSLELSSEQQIYDMVRTIKRKLYAELLQLTEETVESRHDAEAELQELRRLLGLP